MELMPGYAHRGSMAPSSVYNGAMSRYLTLSTAFNMKTH